MKKSLFPQLSTAIALSILNLSGTAFAHSHSKAETIQPKTSEKSIDVISKDIGNVCAVKVIQGEIIGITHAVHEGILAATRTAYRKPYTIFSIAVGDETYTTNYHGIVHKKDFVGVVTKSDCRKPTAAVIPLGPLTKNNS